MKYLFWALAVYLAYLLQGSISVLSVTPNLTAILAYYSGIKYGETKGLLAGLIIGGIEDSISLNILGPNMLGKGLTGFFSSFFLSGGLLVWTPLLGIFSMALLTFAGNSATLLSLGIFDKAPGTPSSLLFFSTMQSLLNAIAGAFIKPSHAD